MRYRKKLKYTPAKEERWGNWADAGMSLRAEREETNITAGGEQGGRRP